MQESRGWSRGNPGPAFREGSRPNGRIILLRSDTYPSIPTERYFSGFAIVEWSEAGGLQVIADRKYGRSDGLAVEIISGGDTARRENAGRVAW
jgi:hypothetical protein